MLDILQTLISWLEQKRDLALAIVVKTWGSSPRQPGAWMVATDSGEFTGSVSGGCVESAVIEAMRQSIRTQETDLLHYGVADETAWEVGLACGGEIDIFLRPITQSQPELVDAFLKIGACVKGEPAYRFAHVIKGPEGYLGQYYFSAETGESFGDMDPILRDQIQTSDEGWSTTSIEEVAVPGGRVSIFVERRRPPSKLVIVGGVHIAIPLAAQAKSVGFSVYIVEPRKAFGKETRFPEIDGVLPEWPEAGFEQIGIDSSTAVAVLTHDPKIDDPALRVALASPAFYVGALGSEKTQAKRRKRLLEGGVSGAQLEKLHAPIGLDLGGRAPAEIALSIMAEIVAVRSSLAVRMSEI